MNSPTINPTWLPDWRNADLYPQEMSDAEWRWQFLRRHPIYQSTWESMQFVEGCKRYIVSNAFFAGNFARSREEAVEIAGMGPGVEIWPVIAHEKVTERFAVKFLIDPAIDRIPPVLESHFWNSFQPFSWVGCPTPEQWGREYDKGKRSLVFDLHLPLKLQLEHAKMMLEKEKLRLGLREPDTRAHRNLFRLYLRLLDARASTPRPSWSEIGSHAGMFDEPSTDPAKTAEQKYSAAEAHRNKHSH